MSAFHLLKSIRSRLLLVAIVPVVVVAVVLSWLGLSIHNKSLSEALLQSGDSMAAYIAATAELAMYAEDERTLSQLGQSGLKTPAVVTVGFVSMDDRLLAIAGNEQFVTGLNHQCSRTDHWLETTLLYLCKPVVESIQSLSDFDASDFSVDRQSLRQLGWVVMVLSREGLTQKQHENIYSIIIISFWVVFLTAYFGLRISRGISKPILNLEKIVGEFDQGSFVNTAKVEGPRETRVLASGINRLASSVALSQEQLEEKVKDATQQLMVAMDSLAEKNSALEVTQQELHSAIDAKDQFLARMSHELRTPLTAVIGFSRLLKRSNLTPEQKNYSDNVNAASQLLLGVIDDLLSFSKLNGDVINIECIDFDLYDSVQQLMTMHSHQTNDSSVQLLLNIAPDVPRHIVGDSMRLNQIINNLLSNAIKFTDYGTVELNVDIVEKTVDGLVLSFAVRDTGIGIEKEAQSILFEPFTQADDSITRRFGGTGLGLVICKQLAELMGGNITLKSELGEGALVTVSIPFSYSVGERVLKKSAELVLIGQQYLQGLTILVAEDNDFNRALIKSLLNLLGAKVVAVSNGHEAVLQYEYQSFDVVLMDLHMPVMDGITATKKIVQQAPDHGVAVLGLTANALENESSEFLHAGALDVLYKPIDERLFIETLCEVTGRPRPYQSQLQAHNIEKIISKKLLYQDLSMLLDNITGSFQRKDFNELGGYIHELLGLSGLFGMDSLKKKVDVMHAAHKSNDYDMIEPIITSLREEIKALNY